MLQKFSITLLLLLAFQTNKIFSQSSLSAGGYLGGGIISGNTASKGSFTSSLFFELNPRFFQDLSVRLSFLYHADINSILPNSTKRYIPFLKGYGLKGITFQNIKPIFYIEEGLGIIALHDRTISGTNQWDYGVSFSVAGGIDFRTIETAGFKLSIGSEYGLTFFNTLPSYFALYFQVHYFFF